MLNITEAKRQLFANSLQRQLLREKELVVQRIEHDRHYLADREKEERQANAQLVIEHDGLGPNSPLKWLPFGLPCRSPEYIFPALSILCRRPSLSNTRPPGRAWTSRTQPVWSLGRTPHPRSRTHATHPTSPQTRVRQHRPLCWARLSLFILPGFRGLARTDSFPRGQSRPHWLSAPTACPASSSSSPFHSTRQSSSYLPPPGDQWDHAAHAAQVVQRLQIAFHLSSAIPVSSWSHRPAQTVAFWSPGWNGRRSPCTPQHPCPPARRQSRKKVWSQAADDWRLEVGKQGLAWSSYRSGSRPLVPQSYTSLQSSLSDFQSQLAQKQKRLLPVEQIFHSKASEFREAVAAILGVKLAFYPNGQVRVTSIFDLDASFVFEPLRRCSWWLRKKVVLRIYPILWRTGSRRNRVPLALLLVLRWSVMGRERRDDSVDCSIGHEIMTPLKSLHRNRLHINKLKRLNEIFKKGYPNHVWKTVEKMGFKVY